jgi:hypothetical protein
MENSIAVLGGQFLDFPVTNATVNNMLEWFRMEVQASPTSFAECNKNITCFALASVFRMLEGVECEHLLELKKLALLCDASVLHNVPGELDKIDRKLVKYWWTEHGLPYCMQKVEKEENRVTFATMPFSNWQGCWVGLLFANNSGFSQPEADGGPEGDGTDGNAGRAGGDTRA